MVAGENVEFSSKKKKKSDRKNVISVPKMQPIEQGVRPRAEGIAVSVEISVLVTINVTSS